MEEKAVSVCVCVGVWVCGCVGVWVCGGRVKPPLRLKMRTFVL